MLKGLPGCMLYLIVLGIAFPLDRSGIVPGVMIFGPILIIVFYLIFPANRRRS
jgi:hypothetical protein